ncbi:MAG: AAA family ATPase [Micropruina sp.]|nr:AAA family ATPase [Micropruina sp.]
MTILDAALSWAARGFRVFPITPGDKVPPKGLAWKDEATTDAAKIRSWWAFEPNYNYAVAAGGGTLIVDVDAGKNGFAALLDLDIPDTLTVKTPGGGMHLYLHGPDVQNSVDRIAPGIDIRSAGGYVVGPGSVFADPGGKKGYTGTYHVADSRAPAEAAPGFVLVCGEPKQREHGPAMSVDEPDDIVFAIHYLLKDAPVAIEGRGGNNTTYAVAARVIEIGVSAERAADLMAEHWNERCLPPWSREELLGIARNAETYAQRRQGSGGITAAAGDWSDAVVLPPAPPPSAAGKFDKVFAARTMTPIELIPARDWIMHRLLLRSEATVLAGPGGVGKSGFSLALAAHGAVGRAFAGFGVSRPFKTVIYNLEDSRHEMEARLYAACAVYDLDPREIEKHVLLWPGRELRFRLMNRDHTFAMADIQELARLTKRDGFDAVVLDPLVSLHHEDENDNTAMGEVMDALNGLARLARVAVLALHHTPKAVRQAGSSDAVRGAGNIVNAVRIASTIYAADETDAALYGFGDGYKARYVRIDDAKQNMAALETKPLWLEKQSFPLPCGDASYAMRIMEPSATAASEAKFIATILASHMAANGTMHMATYDAAKVLTAADAYFRDKVPASGDLRHVKNLIELRLAQPVRTDEGETLRAVAKTEPGAHSARMFVELG